VSYDLGFWKVKPGVKLEAQEVYEKLCRGERVEGLEEPPIEEIIERIHKAFAVGWTRLDHWTWEAPKKSFQVFTTPQFFHLNCGGMTGQEMNVFVEIGLEFDCFLYDPQTGIRYEGI
jgi:hypothetical protein